MNYWDYIKIKTCCTAKETIKTERQPTNRENLFANDISDKGLVSKICKEFMQLKPQKTIQLKNGQKTPIDISPKKTSRWPTDTWKDAHHHSSSGKYKSKLQQNINSLLSEWLNSTTQGTTGVCEDTEKEAHFCTACGNGNWCSLSGKQYGHSSKC